MEDFGTYDIWVLILVFIALIIKFGLIGYFAYRNSKKNKEHMARVMAMKEGKSYDDPI